MEEILTDEIGVGLLIPKPMGGAEKQETATLGVDATAEAEAEAL